MRESLILEKALSGGGEFAELFLEDREETNIQCADGVHKGVKSIRIHGAGLYLLNGTDHIYVYTNRTDEAALMELAGRAADLMNAGKAKSGNIQFQQQNIPNPNSVRLYPGEVANSDKLRVLDTAWRFGRDYAKERQMALSMLNVDYFDTDQRVHIFNSEGLETSDRRVTTRIRTQAAITEDGRGMSDWFDYTSGVGFEAYDREECYTGRIGKELSLMKQTLHASSASTCRVPVIIEAGDGGTLWHECCGHTLEACAIAGHYSAFEGKLGEAVASEKVTLLDDGTMPGLYGSAAVDDEGHPRQRNVLIKNGVLKTYLCDRLHGKMIGLESNGCGRRQNYTYAPTSRMSNTYLAPGTDDEEEMIRSVPEGLFVKSLGGGTGGMQFSLEVKEGYWIKNGQIAYPVKGIMLTGSGIDVMKKVDRVGSRLEYDMGAFCGAASGLCPTTAFQPRVRISEMMVGGEGTVS